MVPDALVAGAGIIGSSIAWRLAQRGARVLLCDAGRMGAEASWAGAGMLAPGGEIERPSAFATLALESLSLYPDFVRELEQESGETIDFQRHGAVELAFTPTELAELDRRAAAQAAIGIPSQRIAVTEFPLLSAAVAGARFFPHDAVVNPRDVMRALRAACTLHGVEIAEGVRVQSVDAAPGGVRVTTSAGVREVSAAVIAAGAWSGVIAVTVEGRRVTVPPCFPVRGHLIGFDLPAASLAPIARHGHTYLIQRTSGFTIAGTTSERVGFDRTLDPAAVADIRARAARLLPRLASLEPTEAWLGFRPGAEGDSPAISRVEGAPVWLAYGHYRNGILLAPATAARITRAMSS